MSTAQRLAAIVAIAGVVSVIGAAFAELPVWLVAGAGAGALAIVVAALFADGTRAPDASPIAPAIEVPILSGSARAVLEALQDPVVVLDGTGRVRFANRVSTAVLGANPERKHITAVLRVPQILEAVERVLAGGPPEVVTLSFLVPIERHYDAYVASAGPDHDRAVIVQFHDFTAARRAEQMRADFIANASHELRTPLAAVSGFIETLRGHAKDDAEARDRFLEIMADESERMKRLIDNLLSLTRIELNEHIPPSDSVDLVGVARDAARALAPLADRAGATIDIAQHAPAMVVGQRDELMQVFQNLMHNAIKYGRERGRVVVSFGDVQLPGRPDGRDFVYAEVKDEGEGIPPEVIPRLTERFYRADTRRSREKPGTGLGLAIVKHILNRHHGRLQIASTPGQGSTFTIYLPAQSRAVT